MSTDQMKVDVELSPQDSWALLRHAGSGRLAIIVDGHPDIRRALKRRAARARRTASVTPVIESDASEPDLRNGLDGTSALTPNLSTDLAVGDFGWRAVLTDLAAWPDVRMAPLHPATAPVPEPSLRTLPLVGTSHRLT